MNIYRTIKERGPKTSFIMMFLLGPCFGMLYMNKWKWALGYTLLFFGIDFWEQYIVQSDYDQNDLRYTLINTALTLAVALHAHRIAKKKEFPETLSWYARAMPPLLAASLILSVLLIPVRTFLYEPFHIPSTSMIPALEVNDYLMADKSAYGYSRYSLPLDLPLWHGTIFEHAPKRGDIVLFDLPQPPHSTYIKRVIGLPGDTIAVKDGIIYLNHVPLPQKPAGTRHIASGDNEYDTNMSTETLPDGTSYTVLHQDKNDVLDNVPETTVPEDHYYMLGDNRDHSQDSRVLGPIPKDNLIGKAYLKLYNGLTQSFDFHFYPDTFDKN